MNKSIIHQDTQIPQLYLQIIKEYICKIYFPSYKWQELNFKSTSSLCNTSNISYEMKESTSCIYYINDTNINLNIENETLLHKSILQPTQWTQPWIKQLRYNADKYRSIIELSIGMMINKLCKKVPNFCLTLGVLGCDTLNNAQKSTSISSIIQSKLYNSTQLNIIQERIEGITLSEWLEQSKNITKSQLDKNIILFYSIILQIAFALSKAQEKKEFVHNALYASNIILTSHTLTKINYCIGSIRYSIIPDKIIPIIIDYASARIVHKGFAISYAYNPVIYLPGKDLYQLLSDCLIITNGTLFGDKIKWLNNYCKTLCTIPQINNTLNCNSLNNEIDQIKENIISSTRAINFIEWFQMQQGDLFSQIVSIHNREIIPLHLDTIPQYCKLQNKLPLLNIKELKLSGIINKVINGNQYNISTNEHEFDRKLLNKLEEIINAYVPQYCVINYNFPLTLSYNNDCLSKTNELNEPIIINYHEILPNLFNNYKSIQTYISFIRLANIIGINDYRFQTDCWSKKEITRYNISIIKNLPLYHLFRLTNIIQNKTITNGNDKIISEELPIILTWIKDLWSPISSFIHNNITLNNVLIPSHKLYYNTATLSQIKYSILNNKTNLINTCHNMTGIDKEILEELFADIIKHKLNKLDDVQFYKVLQSLINQSQWKLNKNKYIRNTLNTLLDQYSGSIKSAVTFRNNNVSIFIGNILSLNKNQNINIQLGNCSMMCNNSSTNTRYINCDWTHPLPIADKSIDLVCVIQFLHCLSPLPNKRKNELDFILSELRRICRGVLVINEYIINNINEHMLMDITYSIEHLILDNNFDVKILNDHIAWYNNISGWRNKLQEYNFYPIIQLDGSYKDVWFICN